MRFLSILIIGLVGLAFSCSSKSAASDSASVAVVIDHPFFPLVSGSLSVFEGEHNGALRREEVLIPVDTRVIQGMECTPVVQITFVNFEITELTTEWYSQDPEGNVWKHGEESYDLVNGELRVSVDSWLAGEDGAEPWIEFSADPKVGEKLFGYRPDGFDEYTVTSLTKNVAVPAGDFDNCMEVLENPDDPEDKDIILYARGVGKVSEKSSKSRIVLVERKQQ